MKKQIRFFSAHWRPITTSHFQVHLVYGWLPIHLQKWQLQEVSITHSFLIFILCITCAAGSSKRVLPKSSSLPSGRGSLMKASKGPYIKDVMILFKKASNPIIQSYIYLRMVPKFSDNFTIADNFATYLKKLISRIMDIFQKFQNCKNHWLSKILQKFPNCTNFWNWKKL